MDLLEKTLPAFGIRCAGVYVLGGLRVHAAPFDTDVAAIARLDAHQGDTRLAPSKRNTCDDRRH